MVAETHHPAPPTRAAGAPPTDHTLAASASDVAAPGRVLSWVLRQNRRALVLWAIAVAAISAMYASFYTVMGGPEMEGLIEGMPEGLVAALGYDRIGTPAGYLESTVYGLLAPILLMVFGVAFGARVLAGVEEDGSLELELTSGVGRRRVLFERYAALVLQLAVLTLAVSVSIIAIVVAIDMDVTLGGLAAGGLGMFLFALAVSSVAFAAGAVTGRRAIGLSAGAGLGVLAFVADAFAGMLDDGRWLEIASPFSWYLMGDPLVEGVHLGGFGALLVLTVVALVVAVVTFDRRDLGV
jgi:ABC-2 type transport system permease protein